MRTTILVSVESMDQKALNEVWSYEGWSFSPLCTPSFAVSRLTGNKRESPDWSEERHEPSDVVCVKQCLDASNTTVTPRGFSRLLPSSSIPFLCYSTFLPGCSSDSRVLTSCTATAVPRLLPTTSTFSGAAP